MRTAQQAVEFALRRNKILQGGTKVSLHPSLTRPFRFFFNNLSEDERQVPCCTSTDGDEVELSEEEALETDECRQCTDEERRFPRLATSRLALLTSLTIGSSLMFEKVTASYHAVQRLKSHLRRKQRPLKRQQQKFPTAADNVQTKRLAGGSPFLTDCQLNTKTTGFSGQHKAWRT